MITFYFLTFVSIFWIILFAVLLTQKIRKSLRSLNSKQFDTVGQLTDELQMQD